MWRCLGPDEEFVCDYAEPDEEFVSDYVEYDRRVTVGYGCAVSMLLHGHDGEATVRFMFREHVAGTSFPEYYTIIDAWLAEVKGAGFGVPLPGIIVQGPKHISYGYVRKVSPLSVHVNAHSQASDSGSWHVELRRK